MDFIGYVMDVIEKSALPDFLKSGLYLLLLASIGVVINAVLPSEVAFIVGMAALFLPMVFSLIFIFLAGYELFKAKGYEVVGAMVGAFLVISVVGALGWGYQTWGQPFLQGVMILLSVGVLGLSLSFIHDLRHASPGSGCVLTLKASMVVVMTPLAGLSLAYAGANLVGG